MDERMDALPKVGGSEPSVAEPITQEESDRRAMVLFEEDERVRLRDGKWYHIPPFGLKDGRVAVKLMNSINSNVIVDNFFDDQDGKDKYDVLMEAIHMAFRPYYSDITKEYLEKYVDVVTAKQIIDIVIGLNNIKKSVL